MGQRRSRPVHGTVPTGLEEGKDAGFHPLGGNMGGPGSGAHEKGQMGAERWVSGW